MITYNSMEMGVDSFPVHLKSSLGKILVEEEKKKKKDGVVYVCWVDMKDYLTSVYVMMRDVEH